MAGVTEALMDEAVTATEMGKQVISTSLVSKLESMDQILHMDIRNIKFEDFTFLIVLNNPILRTKVKSVNMTLPLANIHCNLDSPFGRSRLQG